MKIRNGFVSNSSSSSFVCNVCNNMESGYDASLSDVGMFQCKNEHTLCESHRRNVPEFDTDQKRNFIIEKVNSSKYRTDVEKASRTEEIKKYNEDEVEEYYRDAVSDGEPIEFCPICNFEKVDDTEAVRYLLLKNGLTK